MNDIGELFLVGGICLLIGFFSGSFLGSFSASSELEKSIAETCDKQGTFIADGWKFSCSPIAAREGGEK